MTAGSTPDLDTLLAHADWVRRLSLQLCRDQHAAADAAQDTLLAAMRSPPRHAGNLRGFLARALRNILKLRTRAGERSTRRERAVAHLGLAEATADVAARAELHQFLGRCVLDLPEPQRALVLLHYFDGEDVGPIGDRMGMTADAVRGNLRRARDTLRGRLQPSDGTTRQAFGLLLAGARPVTVAALGTLGFTMKWKTTASFAIAALALLVWSQWPQPDASPTETDGPRGGAVAHGDLASQHAAPRDATERVLATPTLTDVATTGSLRVHVLWPDGAPGAGLEVTIEPDFRTPFLSRVATTGDDGTATLHDLTPAKGQVRVDSRRGAQFTIVAGQTTTAEVQLAPGVDVRCLVVDETGLPIPTARVWLSRFNDGDEGQELGPVAADGTFVVRAVPPSGFFVAAVAPGKRRSVLTPVQGIPDTTQEVRIELREPGATLIGRVFLPDGIPAHHARVLVGNRSSLPWHRESVWRHHRAPVETRCDAQGQFRADGLEPGRTVNVWLRAAATAALRQPVQLPSTAEHVATFGLAAGATFRGRATDAAGSPVGSLWVSAYPETLDARGTRSPIGPMWCFDWTYTATDGIYELRHVGAGLVHLEARQEQPRRIAATTSSVQNGETATWDPLLTAGATIAGSVVDEHGQPLVGWEVVSSSEGPDANRRTTTDEQGHFALADCGEIPRRVSVFAPGAFYKFSTAAKLGVRGGTNDLRFVVPLRAIPTATLLGTVRLANGRAPRQAHITMWRAEALAMEVAAAEPDGTFRIGLLPAGTYRVCAVCDDARTLWTPPFVLKGDGRDLGTLQLGPTGSVIATVRGPDGQLLDGVECYVVDSLEGSDVLVAAGHTQRGVLQIPPILNPGTYRFRITGRDQPVVELPFEIGAARQTAVALTVPASIACVLRLQPASEGGLQPISFTWSRDGIVFLQHTDWWHHTVDRLLPRRLVAGQYEVTVRNETGKVARTTFAVAATTPAGTEITIRLP